MKILKGHHYGTPFPWPKFVCGSHWEKELAVSFDDTVRYDIGEDQSDVNKLFGVSFGLHHINSDRIGWRYLTNEDKVEIVAYSYENGQRIKTQHLYYANIGETLRMRIVADYSDGMRRTSFACNDKFIVRNYKTRKHLLSYTLGLYFGGNRTAPHDINVNEC